MNAESVSKILYTIGALFILSGILWQLGLIQNLKIGRLPGDILIENDNMKLYFPFTSGLLISALFGLIHWLFKKF